jgi:hypothetical protein
MSLEIEYAGISRVVDALGVRRFPKMEHVDVVLFCAAAMDERKWAKKAHVIVRLMVTVA